MWNKNDIDTNYFDFMFTLCIVSVANRNVYYYYIRPKLIVGGIKTLKENCLNEFNLL